MSFKDSQRAVDEWMRQYKTPYWRPLEILARLTEEVGELARELNHEFGPKKKKDTEDENEIKDEIADIIFVLICLANSLNIDLDESFETMMRKIKNRDADRWEKK